MLARFGEVADWSRGVRRSATLGVTAWGIGARRRCDLRPVGTAEETISEWVEGQLLVVATDSLSVLPLKRALTSFSLRDLPAVRTGVELRFDYQLESALLTMLLGPVLDRPLARRLRLLLADLEAAATGRSR